ncbi:MAG TPA: hypothetical protein DCM05_16820 [Elusimicrobia bacterium]|nr:hypothetical protein [Elusimicrobiota bacterium]
MKVLILFLYAAQSLLWASPCPPGWDARKWADPNHRTPKYVVGRILAMFPPSPDGLRAALPAIGLNYPGTKLLPGKGDKVRIPCVGEIDLLQSAGTGGKAWQWLVEKDECGSCGRSVCGGEGGTTAAKSPQRTAAAARLPSGWSCTPPNAKGIVEGVLARPGMSKALRRACRNNTDWTFPDAVVDELRRGDLRWGYLCRRGNCGDPSHDVLCYYCGPGQPFERADDIRCVDYIVASCYNDPSDGNPSIGWTLLEPHPPGTPGWTSRGRFQGGPAHALHAPIQAPRLSLPQAAPAPAPAPAQAPAQAPASAGAPAPTPRPAFRPAQGGAPAALPAAPQVPEDDREEAPAHEEADEEEPQ